MNDREIRIALDTALRKEQDENPGILIRHETGLCAGRRRIDVLVLSDVLAGYEIKSDADSLARLQGQAEDYRSVLDQITLVTTIKHQAKAESELPTWWGMTLAHADSTDARLEIARTPGQNPGKDPMALAQILWRDEAMAALRTAGLARGLSKMSRHHLWERLAHNLSVEELSALAQETIRARLTAANPPTGWGQQQRTHG